MRGLDYRWIEALDAIIEQRSFDKAAEELCISQSAVSQRIKQLEKWLAQPVLIREQPPRATDAGKKLLGLYRRVCLLEQDLLPELTPEASEKPLPVSVATNADTLATWLLPSLANLLHSSKLQLNLIVEDEKRTLEKLRSGEVVGAISIEAKPITGCTADYLGTMEYLCVASPEFCQRYFPDGVSRESLMHAPAVVFNQYDQMHEMFIQQHFGLSVSHVVKHTVRSSEAFVKLATLGVAYCLIPKPQIVDELKNGELINIVPQHTIPHELYWHHWQLESGVIDELSSSIICFAKKNLPQG
ncbi:LysR family transcriptional regulator ArgP [Vibrio sp. 99-8-1]|uniref:LysR family transcriptional regulator ArgP n=1 Tax=Vibrio sp. 99-8-1 TaxID=2607602 RepID=UPI001493CC58|nr:LysR family transcriptional regulator ArgP [Vibrio sp. 99-8-1]NOI68367.1 LysR family transcriptional regulator ArgP [Vibrio sp. 99-8-1]